MKKQKKPIVLILVLAVLFGGVMFLNRDTSKDGSANNDPQPEAKQEKKEAVGGDVASQMKNDKKDDKKDAKGSGDTKPGANPEENIKQMHEKSMQRGGPNNTLSLLKPKMSPQNKPKPNDSSISTQWYSNESGRTQTSAGN